MITSNNDTHHLPWGIMLAANRASSKALPVTLDRPGGSSRLDILASSYFSAGVAIAARAAGNLGAAYSNLTATNDGKANRFHGPGSRRMLAAISSLWERPRLRIALGLVLIVLVILYGLISLYMARGVTTAERNEQEGPSGRLRAGVGGRGVSTAGRRASTERVVSFKGKGLMAETGRT